ncbi:hypothetical protein [Microbispora sp. ATCC PTA-5024]|uniref:hypothetical protein n=1 Tax=Microbispora sp. ATCC PTA-5024 TaxID=316330 RepID=UPI0003DDE0D7|nr:hypothetical protein [Microbispora sp. ATCC PTA-5024]ETK34540.1 hypothetical protein MPTA5024_18620 [Microbispora sp. ATCC PTA-5024]
MPIPNLDPDRTAFLDAREKKSPVTVPAWPRSNNDLPQVEVDVTWVRFSTLNHRTKAEQLREIHRTGREDLFKTDPLGPEAQQAQYDILRGQEGFEALKADLEERGQQEPAILTAEGVLINGNRRCAAMRSLYEEDHNLRFQYVKCLVLPKDATVEELIYLEAELQVARDFKQDYSWVNEAMLIEDLFNRADKDWKQVAARMHRKVSDVRDLYDKLQQVHQLVELSQGARLHVDFTENESAFDELARHIKNKPAQEAAAVKAVYFLGTLAGTEYRNLRHLRRADAAELVRRIIEDDPALKPVLDITEASAPGEAEDDLLDDVLGESEPQSPLHNLLSFVATKRPEANVTLSSGDKVAVQDLLTSLKSAITAAAEEAAEEQRDQSAVSAPLVRAGRAIEELKRVLSTLPKARAFDEWDEASLLEKVSQMEKLLAKIKGDR